MKIQKIDLDDNNELIIRTQNESFLNKYISRKNLYQKSTSEIILKNSEQSLCIGICSSNTYTGLKEFIKYTPQCILFFHGNSIKETYCIERVFDIATMSSLFLTKNEILEKYDIELPEEIKCSRPLKKHVKQKAD